MLVSTMKTGTPDRDKQLVAAIYQAMLENAPRIGRNLTDKQRNVLRALYNYQAAHGHSPTFEELGTLIGKTRAGAHEVCQVLRKKGYIAFGGKWRAIRILDRGR